DEYPLETSTAPKLLVRIRARSRLPHGVNNDIAGKHGKMINSSADDKRGIVKLGFTPRENDEYTLTYIKQDGEKDNPPY
ncbi:TonB-dependent outer membrane receptor protein, partial [human gut metagenome]